MHSHLCVLHLENVFKGVHIDRHTGRQTGRQADGQAARRKAGDGQMNRQRDGQADPCVDTEDPAGRLDQAQGSAGGRDG